MPDLPPIEVLPRDLSAWEAGNTGTPFVHRFDGFVAGPTALVVGLTHGNEFCGAETLHWALSQNLRPLKGTLVLAFANVAAYRRFDAANPLDSRFVDRDMNRVWREDWLEAEQTVEAKRARELRPFVDAADFVLDIHSTSYDVRPFFVGARVARARALATRIGYPRSLLLEDSVFEGRTMVEYTPFAAKDGSKTALVVECGAHFLARSVDVAKATFLDFLGCLDMLDADFIARNRPHVAVPPAGIYDVSVVHVAKSDNPHFVQPFVGFEEVDEGTLIARDGDLEIRAPYPRCTVLFPKAIPAKGRELVTLGRRVD
jgi:succinylglutamate desuccinylase